MTNWDQRALTSLYRTLANLYPMAFDALRLSRDAELPLGQITFDNKAFNTWSSVVQVASQQQKIDTLLNIALDENSGEKTLLAIKADTPPPQLAGEVPLDWKGKSSETLEKILGKKSTLVPISYLEVGLQRARSVARVVRNDGASGTGFIVEGGWLLTNHHVLPNKETAVGGTAEFNYQKTWDGLDAQVASFPLDAESLLTCEADDWSAVRLIGDHSAWGVINWNSRPKNRIKVDDHVNIIQHPGGTFKQISLVANLVTYVGNGRIQYLTDTLPGSSGAPVFDSEWNLVALHHAGGNLVEPGSSDKKVFFRNQGIEIEQVIDGISKAEAKA